MINLFIPYYIDRSEDRQKEIDACLVYNKRCAHVDNIFLVTEDPSALDYNLEDEKTKLILISERPTYATMFEIMGENSGHEDYNVLINSDIYTDETIENVKKYGENDFLVLARWDVDKAGNAVHFNTWCSQDTWVFKGKPRKINADFYQGIAGCDNAIANRAEVAGYRVLNPSKTIKTYHLHNSGVKNYNPNNKVPQPYKLINPHE